MKEDNMFSIADIQALLENNKSDFDLNSAWLLIIFLIFSFGNNIPKENLIKLISESNLPDKEKIIDILSNKEEK